ncbi:hypothetical protein ACYCFK_09250 [Stutzerimonas stutzeri]
MTNQHSTTAFIPTAAQLLSLPVVFTPEAWQQAIHLESNTASADADLEDRLSSTLEAAYQATLAAPSKHVVDFGLHRLPPDGNPHSPLWLDLQASRPADSQQPMQLLISLKQPLTQAA